jgi:hypothetical protein
VVPAPTALLCDRPCRACLRCLRSLAGSYDLGLDDLHRLDLSTYTWTDLTPLAQGRPPKPRGGHGVASLNGRLYVFGGTKGNDFGESNLQSCSTTCGISIKFLASINTSATVLHAAHLILFFQFFRWFSCVLDCFCSAAPNTSTERRSSLQRPVRV